MNKKTISWLFNNENHFQRYDDVNSRLYGERLSNVFVSIMIPTYKRLDLLKKAIKSALEQDTNFNYEVVIVDNDPDTREETIKELLNSFDDSRLSYYQNEQNIGMFGNWNRCISLAKGEWLIILNDDDEVYLNYLSRMQDYINRYPKSGAFACQHILVDENDKIVGRDLIKENKSNNHAIPIRMKDFYFFHPTNIYGCFINRDIALSIGGFDENLWPCSDAAFLIQICENYELYLCTDVLFKYRWAVNESQRPETRIGFAQFNILKSYVINKRHKLFNIMIDNFLRNCLCDNEIYNLMSVNAIDSSEIREFKDACKLDGKYNNTRRQIGRVICKLYRYNFSQRNKK